MTRTALPNHCTNKHEQPGWQRKYFGNFMLQSWSQLFCSGLDLASGNSGDFCSTLGTVGFCHLKIFPSKECELISQVLPSQLCLCCIRQSSAPKPVLWQNAAAGMQLDSPVFTPWLRLILIELLFFLDN